MNERVAKEKVALVFCKIMHVLSRIGQYCLCIGVLAIVCLMVLCPYLFKHISINEGEVSIFDFKINYVLNESEDELTFSLDEKITDETYTIRDEVISKYDSNLTVKKLYDEVNNFNTRKLFAACEYTLVIMFISVSVTFFIVRYMAMIFRDTYKNKTPFVKTNAIRLYRMSILSLIEFIFITSIIVIEEITLSYSISFNSYSISNIILFYILSWAVCKGMETKTAKKTKKVEE